MGFSGLVGQIVITPVYWAPSGYTFASGYKSIINGYLANVAADSQKNTNVFSVGTQYYQQPLGGAITHIQYGVQAGAEVDDSTVFPAQGGSNCTANAGFTACVDDTSLQSELQTLLTAHSLVKNDSELYVVMFPPAVETCTGPGVASSTNQCSTNVYCAYHSGVGPPYVIYTNQPYPDLAHCSGGQAPNGDAEADAQVSLISHEANEAITDTFNAWNDATGFENGDECAYVFGSPLGGAGGAFYNQAIGTGHYYTQDEFSNEDYALGLGDNVTTTGPAVPGCVQREELPTAVFTYPALVLSATPVPFDGSGSSDSDGSGPLTYSWVWGDGTLNGSGAMPTHTFAGNGMFTVTLTATDADGWSGPVSHTLTVHSAGVPMVTGVSPNHGTPSGGTVVTLTGSNFNGGVIGVNFGATAASGYSVVSDTQLTATSPAHAAGVVDITVTTIIGTNPTAPADQFTFIQNVYVLSGYGGVYEETGPQVIAAPSWPGWSIAESAHPRLPGGTTQQGFFLDGYGGLHPYGAAGLAESGTNTHYWGFDIARDFAFMPDGSGGFVLDGYGGLHPFHVNGSTAALAAQGNSYWGGWDIARKVVIFPDATGGYVLDAFGGLHPFGINGPPPAGESAVAATSYFGWNIARDVVLVPGNGNHSGYVLDGYGGMHPFHPTGDGSVMPPAISSAYIGWDILRGVTFINGSATDGYTLDGYGGLHPFGAAPAITSSPYFGRDIAKETWTG